MRVGITGGTGYLGRALTVRLVAEGAQVVVYTRRPDRPNPFPAEAVSYLEWDPEAGAIPPGHLDVVDAVVHLAGEPLDTRWTKAARSRIWNSRVVGTSHLVRGWTEAARPPRVLVSGSAVGYYGDRGNDVLEEAAAPGTGFLAELAGEWEKAAAEAAARGTRVAWLRTGMVLGPDCRPLAKLLPWFRAGLGTRLGSGRQWWSWIHLDDWVDLVLFALRTPALKGAVNAVSPNPATNAEFTRALARGAHRAAPFAAPAFLLKLMLGEMATTVLSSQRAHPRRAADYGFRFSYERVDLALKQILAKR